MSSENVDSFFDISVLQKSSYDDENNMREFLELLLVAIDDASVKIGDAIKRTSRKDLLIKIHTIKSNFRICGFLELFQTANSLEKELNSNSTINVAEINSFLDQLQTAKRICVDELAKM